MPGHSNIISTVAVFALIAVATSLSLGEVPRPAPAEADNDVSHHRALAFRLDQAWLYPGGFWRSAMLPQYFVSSLEDLAQRVAHLPRGATLYYELPRGDFHTEGLVRARDLSWFKAYCRSKGVRLIVER